MHPPLSQKAVIVQLQADKAELSKQLQSVTRELQHSEDKRLRERADLEREVVRLKSLLTRAKHLLETVSAKCSQVLGEPDDAASG
jgi:hypothetical protein